MTLYPPARPPQTRCIQQAYWSRQGSHTRPDYQPPIPHHPAPYPNAYNQPGSMSLLESLLGASERIYRNRSIKQKQLEYTRTQVSSGTSKHCGRSRVSPKRGLVFGRSRKGQWYKHENGLVKFNSVPVPPSRSLSLLVLGRKVLVRRIGMAARTACPRSPERL